MNPDVALFYDDDAHFEASSLPSKPQPRAPGGLFGRHVANSEFLEAWLSHGAWQRMVGVVTNQLSSQSLARRFSNHPKVQGTARHLDIVGLPQFQRRFFPQPPAQVLHLPQPIDSEFAWIRHHKRSHAFALSGVTHTMSLKGAMERFCDLVTGPFESYDTLFCISKAAVNVIRSVTDNYAAFLRERDGGDPRVRLRLSQVPFGVDAEKFQPASPEERSAARQQLGIAPDEVCVLFVGRLSYYSKVHPFPMYRAAAEAARRVGCKVHLVLAGWADAPSILQKFQHGAKVLAPGVKTTMVDGMQPGNHARVWKAADVFTSMSDNIQETLGLTILEAQACGLPVVTTDWDGCRESVAPGETGFLVSTRMVAGATAGGTSRHLMGETGYGEFLGETNQTVAVDSVEATNAFDRLFADAALRARMGLAGRARILDQFTWPHVIRQYETVWSEQEAIRREHAATALAAATDVSTVHTPVSFPDVEYSFASYPSAFLGPDATLMAAPDAAVQLGVLLQLPLTNYVPAARIVEPSLLLRVVETAKEPCALETLEAVLGAGASDSQRRRATLAWLLKYDLLRVE
jgi:glycosyltransferase involved in cell wall biosynthesis